MAMGKGRHLTKTFWEEMIMNRYLKTDFRFLGRKKTELLTVMPYIFEGL